MLPPLQAADRPIWGPSPDRVCERTGNFNEYGQPLWVDRPWRPSERAEYICTILNREPYPGEK